MREATPSFTATPSPVSSPNPDNPDTLENPDNPDTPDTPDTPENPKLPMIKIKYKSTQAIRQADFVHLLILVDEQEKRQLVVVTDHPTAMSITAMASAKQDPVARRLFFKRSAVYALAQQLPEDVRKLMYIHVHGLVNGQYNAVLKRQSISSTDPPAPTPPTSLRGELEGDAAISPLSGVGGGALRISEAILLSIVADVPMYIDEHLWRTQSTAFDPASNGMAIPANTLPLNMLKSALRQAIDNEQYEVAKVLNDEIHNRFPQERQ